jgi:hypothetical protein
MLNGFNQFRGWLREGCCTFEEHRQGWLAFAAFKFAVVGAVNARKERESVLGDAEFYSPCTEYRPTCAGDDWIK